MIESFAFLDVMLFLAWYFSDNKMERTLYGWAWVALTMYIIYYLNTIH